MGLRHISIHKASFRLPETQLLPFAGITLCLFNALTFGLHRSDDMLVLLALVNILSCVTYIIIRIERLTRFRHQPLEVMQNTIDDVHHMIQHILHAYFEQHQLEFQLANTQATLERFHTEQQQLMLATQQEVTQQYTHILAYAHYLEQRITSKKSDISLREDYDDVCEQAFNLQLIVQAMGMLPAMQFNAPPLTCVPLTDRMSSILLDITPSLDRRAMKLTSAEWDDTINVHSNSEWLTHTLWMMLLGCIRFAEQESTLTLRCQREGGLARLEVVVSFLDPGMLSETERYAYLEKRLREGAEDAHMFASTLEAHANIQLGKLLASRLMAQLSVTPLSSHSCTLTLLLPCA